MTHEEIGELLGAYVLDALSTEEREAVDTHLATCGTCTAEVEQLLSVHDQLGLLAIERDPPPELRIRLMNLVELDRRQFEQEQATAQSRAGRTATAPVQPARGWRERLRHALGTTPRLVYGIGGALVAAAIVLIVILVTRNPVTIHNYACAVQQSPPGVNLQATHCTIGVRSDHTTDVAFTNLPALPPNKAYELWLIDPKKGAVPIEGFVADPNHAYTQRLSQDAGGASEAAVTIEPAPGNSSKPTLPIVLLVKLKG